ncbi:MAG TPA: hypothetical protein VJA21_30235 [Verrucomicrobiae bacterium]
MRSNCLIHAAAALLLGIPSGSGCDLCAIYAAGQARGEVGQGPFVGLGEQFTHYGTLQYEGHEVANPADQSLDSSITQVLVGYNVSERFGLQLNLPFIYRSFRRPEASAIHEGTESGIGDGVLLATHEVMRFERRHSTFVWSVLAGVKFPTGSTSRLREETQEGAGQEGPIASGIHGHDLTLGSGSYDGLVGTSAYARRDRLFLTGTVQYAIRSRGDYDYRFANDFIWSAAPGYLVLLSEDYTLSVEANVSGEVKGRDEFRGQAAEDTGILAVYVGPQLVFTWHDKISAQVALDWPGLRDNTALQIVPDYRIRAGLTWRF